MPRARTILTPPPYKASRPKPKVATEAESGYKPRPGAAYRCRPIGPNPFGETDPPTYSDDREALEVLMAGIVAAGTAAVLERHAGAVYVPVTDNPNPVTVAQLAAKGMATEHPGRSADGKAAPSRWSLTREGEEILRNGWPE